MGFPSSMQSCKGLNPHLRLSMASVINTEFFFNSSCNTLSRPYSVQGCHFLFPGIFFVLFSSFGTTPFPFSFSFLLGPLPLEFSFPLFFFLLRCEQFLGCGYPCRAGWNLPSKSRALIFPLDSWSTHWKESHHRLGHLRYNLPGFRFLSEWDIYMINGPLQ